jgi:hypothetical protein
MPTLAAVDRASRVHPRVPAPRSPSPTSRARRYPRPCPRIARVRGLSGGWILRNAHRHPEKVEDGSGGQEPAAGHPVRFVRQHLSGARGPGLARAGEDFRRGGVSATGSVSARAADQIVGQGGGAHRKKAGEGSGFRSESVCRPFAAGWLGNERSCCRSFGKGDHVSDRPPLCRHGQEVHSRRLALCLQRCGNRKSVTSARWRIGFGQTLCVSAQALILRWVPRGRPTLEHLRCSQSFVQTSTPWWPPRSRPRIWPAWKVTAIGMTFWQGT